MGCELELVLCGQDRQYLADAASEIFEEVSRLEQQMSVFIPTSDLSHLNSCAARKAVRVDPRIYDLLVRAKKLSQETEGAFDISSGALVRLWESREDSVPSSTDIAETLAQTGISGILLSGEEHTVRYARSGIQLNLGAVGKGYAVDRIVALLSERGVNNALVSAGSSTVYAMGAPPDCGRWTVGISDPRGNGERLTSVRLRDQALSTSGSHERYVEIEGRRYSHIIDPRTGWPADVLLLACAIAPDATTGDALSTAFFVLGAEGSLHYCKSRRDVHCLIVTQERLDGELDIVRSEAFDS